MSTIATRSGYGGERTAEFPRRFVPTEPEIGDLEPKGTYTRCVERVTINSKQMGGVPCLRGLRIPVATVVNMIASGLTPAEVIDRLPPLELDDVTAALRYAADRVADREIPLRPSA
jgi:uncharacterized protein (DUF433 family)